MPPRHSSVFPDRQTGMGGLVAVKSASERGRSRRRGGGRDGLALDEEQVRSGPVQKGPNRRAAVGVAATAALEPAAWMASRRPRSAPRGSAAGRRRRGGPDLANGRGRCAPGRIGVVGSGLCTPSRLRDREAIELQAARRGQPGIDDGASIADARTVTELHPQKVWARSTSAGSIVSVPGASETSSKP